MYKNTSCNYNWFICNTKILIDFFLNIWIKILPITPSSTSFTIYNSRGHSSPSHAVLTSGFTTGYQVTFIQIHRFLSSWDLVIQELFWFDINWEWLYMLSIYISNWHDIDSIIIFAVKMKFDLNTSRYYINKLFQREF